MDRKRLEKFKDQIWVTRISRINAEKRLIAKENFFQGINIYYSCVTIIFSVFSLLNKDDKLSLMTLLMTISLLIVILYLNGQKYLTHAREYRKNYTELHKLEMELEHVSEDDTQKFIEIEKSYCELLDTGENHISYDYYCTVYGSTGEFREVHWKVVRFKYVWGTFWRIVIKFMIIVLPFLLLGMYEVV